MSNLDPKISVIMPVFNSQEYLDAAIQSVLAQTFTQFELIVIDDGSTDASLAKLRAWCQQDSRLRLFEHAQNKGIAASRNKGLALASCALVAFIDSDDTWLPEKLERQYAHHNSTQCAFSCTAFWFGRSLVSAKPRITYRDLLMNNVVNTSSVMINTELVQLEFMATQKSEDYIEWLKVAKLNTIHVIAEPLVRRDVFSGVSANKLEMAQQRWRIYRDIEGLSMTSSVYFFMAYTLTGLKKYASRYIN